MRSFIDRLYVLKSDGLEELGVPAKAMNNDIYVCYGGARAFVRSWKFLL